MREPTAPSDWDDAKQQFPISSRVSGTVTVVAPFGVFIDLGVGFEGLLLVPEMAGDNRKQIEDYPRVGQTVTATVLWHNDQRKQFSLTQRLKATAE